MFFMYAFHAAISIRYWFAIDIAIRYRSYRAFSIAIAIARGPRPPVAARLRCDLCVLCGSRIFLLFPCFSVFSVDPLSYYSSWFLSLIAARLRYITIRRFLVFCERFSCSHFPNVLVRYRYSLSILSGFSDSESRYRSFPAPFDSDIERTIPRTFALPVPHLSLATNP
uniref:Uncharacterized protein n=1 Tax=Candidatus Kentrum sp. FM TaxID=2126340 RepID=A0A450VQU6_9GAMM|nr:MAG: hypothetical protein BECKFM1743B_GA0114221_100331 [Candidatus Kentron sp. FM]